MTVALADPGRAAALGATRSATARRGAGRRGAAGLGADLEPGTLLAAYRAGLFPMPRRAPRRRSAGGRRTRAACCRWTGCGSAGRCGRPAAGSRSGSTRRSTTWCAAAPTASGPAAGSARTSWRPTGGCTTWAGCTASRPGRSARRAGAAGRRPVRRGARRAVRGGVDVPPRARRLQGGPGRAGRAAPARGSGRRSHGCSTCSGPPTTWCRWAPSRWRDRRTSICCRGAALRRSAEFVGRADVRPRHRDQGRLE